MTDLATRQTAMLGALDAVQSDSLLSLIALANADQRPGKIDAGVGVYRDGAGRTPILRAVKAAEKLLWERQETKAYLGGRGDTRFAELVRPIVLGDRAGDDRIAALQTPGGCGALRLGFQLIATARPNARVLIGTPTWPNHPPIVEACGMEVVRYAFYDREQHEIRFDEMMSMLDGARAGDVVLLHGCCHNPTGADLSDDQWADVTRTIAHRGLMPVVDIAYQGLGRGLEADARGLRGLVDAVEEIVVAQSCDKNFGVYRDRVGTLFFKTGGRVTTATAVDHALQISRQMWSMPPDHGAAVVRTVLDDPALKADWLAELETMRARIAAVRGRIAAADPSLAYIGDEFGMFAMLPLDTGQVHQLRERHAIFMADSGRFNVVGMADDAIDRFIAAVLEALHG